jgi:uncharacterized protein YyaL (SSP411 family)
MLDLLRLGRITADPGLEQKAARISRIFARKARRLPAAHAMLMTSLDFALGPSREVVVGGKEGADDTRAMLKALSSGFTPNKVVVFVPADREEPRILRYARYAQGMEMMDERATAYVCTDYTCKLPTTDVERMLSLLSGEDGEKDARTGGR